MALADGGAVASYNPVSGKQLAKVGFCGQTSHHLAMTAKIGRPCIWACASTSQSLKQQASSALDL